MSQFEDGKLRNMSSPLQIRLRAMLRSAATKRVALETRERPDMTCNEAASLIVVSRVAYIWSPVKECQD